MKKFRSIGLLALVFLLIPYENLDAQEPGMFQLVGFATVDGNTMGGAGGNVDTVYTGTELQDALKEKQDQETPLILYVEGTINLENSPGLSKIDVKDLRDVSIIGTGTGAEFDGIGIKIWKAGNIIVRNLKIHNVLSGEKDCISIEGPSDHLWIDHCELYNEFQEVEKDYYDGLLDAKRDAEYLTYSWNYLHDSWKTCLIGSSESDIYDRKLTMHHNYLVNCNSRLPLFRASTGHFFNNYYKDIVSTVINSRINACARIEKNYFENAHNPWVSAYSDVLGGGEILDNILVNSPFVYSDDTHELPACTAEIPYDYSEVLHEAADVPSLVQSYAGTGNLPSSERSEKANGDPLKIYPNPARAGTHIRLNSVIREPFEVYLVDLSGRKTRIFNESHGYSGYFSAEVSLEGIEPGFYLVELRSGQYRFTSRLLIL